MLRRSRVVSGFGTDRTAGPFGCRAARAAFVVDQSVKPADLTLDLLQAATRTRERLDDYTLELQRHGLEQVEREVRWLDGLIDTERGVNRATTEGPGPSTGPDTVDGAQAPQH